MVTRKVVHIGDGTTDMEASPPAVSEAVENFDEIFVQKN